MFLTVLMIPNLLRTLLIIVGIMVIVRFIGRVMNAKRNLDKQQVHKANQAAYNNAKEASKKNLGKVSIKKGSVQAEDVDYEEVD